MREFLTKEQEYKAGEWIRNNGLSDGKSYSAMAWTEARRFLWGEEPSPVLLAHLDVIDKARVNDSQ